MNKKNILVTGSDGFIGKHLVKRLTGKQNVTELTISDGDITNINLNRIKADFIFHLAAQTYVPKSWENPYDFYKTNILGTANILEYCRKSGAKLIYVSAYVYGKPDELPIDENHILNPANPYMHSKILAESLCEFYHKNYNVGITIIRPFNIYGPSQSNSFLMPTIINQVLSCKDTIEVFDLEPKRDYLYIDDLIDALEKTISLDNDFMRFNIGYGKSFSVKEIIDTIQDIAKTNKKIITKNQLRKNEIPDVVADISSAKEKLKWYPKYSLKKGLRKYIEYYED